MTNPVGTPPEDDTIARLLEAAGPRSTAPKEREDRVRDAARAHWRRSLEAAPRRRIPAWIAAALAAAAVVAIVTAWEPWSRGPRRPGGDIVIATLLRSEGSIRRIGGTPPRADGGPLRAGDALAPGTSVEAGPEGRAALALADGSSLRIDSGTRVRLLAGPTLELERGAIYVDSGPGRRGRRAFLEVRTRLGVVRDIGTQFEVRLTADELWVSVREGLATLATAGRSFGAPAGTRLVAGGAGVESRPLEHPDWGWVLDIAPAFEMDGKTLHEYLDWLARETGWRIEFADPGIARESSTVVLHGSVTVLRPDETPAAVLPTCGLTHRLSDGTLVIERLDGAGRPR
jgi:ferric-dicitrate binding protein FerR (iron transport regulator)